ncbi:hypothetical protein K2Q00_02660 [Patescibacteria group bacterium]|nr:hypothetical protein [Patescibacteria group bacterium]
MRRLLFEKPPLVKQTVVLLLPAPATAALADGLPEAGALRRHGGPEDRPVRTGCRRHRRRSLDVRYMDHLQAAVRDLIGRTGQQHIAVASIRGLERQRRHELTPLSKSFMRHA